MLTEITADFLKPYFRNSKKHKAYAETVKLSHDIRIHADGLKPGELLTERRPSESETIKAYREKIYIPVTKSVFSKIISSLNKIRKSQDWNIKYDADKISSKLREGERLQDYCEVKYPYFQGITNWMFDVCLRNYVIDANAVCLVIPLQTEIDESDFLKPYTIIFNSENVFDFVQDDYCVLKSTDKSTYRDGDHTFYDGDIFYAVNTIVVQRWEQVKRDGTTELKMEYNHGIGLLPAFKLGGMFREAQDLTFIYESRISSIVPRLNEAVREYSDLQAEVVQHIHSEKWVYSSQECTNCSGTGQIIKGEKAVKCGTCKGVGVISTSPYSHMVVKPPTIGQTNVPTPPAGYIQKQIEIVKIQDERVQNHIIAALSSINMEFLAATPLSQSGVAKEVDRDELNNFVNSIAENLVNIMDKIYFLINEYRNAIIIPNKKERIEQLPSIAVPTKFDLLNSSFLVDELGKAKLNNMNPVLINALEMDYVNKKFDGDIDIKNDLTLVLNLDPFQGLSEDVKMSMLQNGGITKTDYIVSSNIGQFIARAVDEYDNAGKLFVNEDRTVQIELLNKYAQEIINSNSAASDVMKVVQQQSAA